MKLRVHLLPRIQSRLQEQNLVSNVNFCGTQPQCELDFILFKDNRIYNHKLARLYHTTYDMRRSEDLINPHTSHCDIMLLAPRECDTAPSFHPFLYARVLGIFHTNVLYNGPDITSYEAMRFDFLWVRWFDLTRGSHLSLDHLVFPPMASRDAFGFVDPALILRSCHLLPVFAKGKRHLDGIGLSRSARDGQEWKSYFVNRQVIARSTSLPPYTLHPSICRFVDRDMLMRYHWGLGIGHTYSHAEVFDQQKSATQALDEDVADESDTHGCLAEMDTFQAKTKQVNCSENPELDICEQDDLNLDESDSESDSKSSIGGQEEEWEDCDDKLLELMESYYTYY